MITSEDILRSYLDQTKIDLISNYNQMGLRASGQSENISVNVSRGGDNLSGKLVAPLQWYFMENGRKPNKNPSKGQIYFLSQVLADWAKKKGIVINPWMAAKKIATEGIKVPNRYNSGGVISKVVNDEWLNELNKQLVFSVTESFKSIIKQWQ